MKTKLVQLVWRGESSVDPRFSSFMLPWTLADIRNHDNHTRLSVGIEHGIFEAYNVDFELQFAHQLKYIVGMCRVIQKPQKSKSRNFEFIAPKAVNRSNSTSDTQSNQIAEIYGPENGMVYLLKNPRDPLLHIHLFESESVEEMTELMHQIAHTNTIGGSVGNIPQSIVASPRSGDTNFQKALRNNGVHSTPASNLKYSEAMRHAPHDTSPSTVGRMSASKSYTSGLSHSAGAVNMPTSASSSNLSLLNDISPNNSQFFEVMYVGKIKVSHKRVPFTFIDDALPKFRAYDAQKIKMQTELQRRASTVSSESGSQENISTSQKITDDMRAKTERIKEVDETKETGSEENKENLEDAEVEEARDKPTVLRSQSHYSISATNGPPKQRDRAASIGSIPIVEQNRTMVFLIGRSDLRLISPDRKQVLLYKDFKDVASCAQGQKNADHFGIICREMQNDGYIGYVFKCQSENVANDIIAAISQAFITCSEAKQKEKSQILSCDHCPMLWYHKLCQDIEGLSDKKTQAAIFKRMETLAEDEQTIILAKYNGADDMAGHTIAEQSQFLMMLLRAHCEARQQRHVHDTAENRTEFLNQYLGGSTIFMKAKRSLTSSFDHLLKRKGSQSEGLPPAPVITTGERKINLEETGSRNRISGDFSQNNMDTPQLKSPMIDIFMKVGNNPDEHRAQNKGSWRQAMLHRVVTPSKGLQGEENAAEFMSPMRPTLPRKKTSEDYRRLWKDTAKQIIMLSRMEKENARLQHEHSEHETKRIKLEYDDITPCSKMASDNWDNLLEQQSRITQKPDSHHMLMSVRNGVPKIKRGEVWLFLAEQFNRHTPPIDTQKFPNYHTPYDVLLKNLTEHQHAIFIDLGRTFPNHQYYKAALGVGQLALFNLLKAYSILDPELGYCQGLGFLCGILLLHLEEADAFALLKHLMFRRQMRLKYLPDMKQFQLQLYQLSRLLKDTVPELYEHLDRNDVSPTLYAAPWILTVFSSQFPLGFVARVFDLLFLESSETIFRIALALLSVHKEELLKRENFEEIMNYLKNVVPKMDSPTMELILKEAFANDISHKLTEYQVEYNVLQEEITSQNHHMENLNRLKENNQHLESQLEIAQSTLAQLEQQRQSHQSQINSLQAQIQSMEVTVQTLGRFLSHLQDLNPDLDLPGDIRRIVQQVNYIDQQQSRRRPVFLDRKIGKSVSVNSHLGLALRVLEEQTEPSSPDYAPTPTTANTSSNGRKKSPFFENTFEQLRRHHNNGSSLNFQNNDKMAENNGDSGIATPLSPSNGTNISSVASSSNNSNKSETESEPESLPSDHPLSNCSSDINVRFNGTTQLKTKGKLSNGAATLKNISQS
ncbi:TBC1 domain family member 4 isoform X2 [Culicoides brevitarsis]|uniref:TBC1 domain family member 4 isoform X2 n=1 Tax=Culicoides brevitarsis TaxID=469753 RepID=UPI00307C9AE5